MYHNVMTLCTSRVGDWGGGRAPFSGLSVELHDVVELFHEVTTTQNNQLVLDSHRLRSHHPDVKRNRVAVRAGGRGGGAERGGTRTTWLPRASGPLGAPILANSIVLQSSE